MTGLHTRQIAVTFMRWRIAQNDGDYDAEGGQAGWYGRHAVSFAQIERNYVWQR